jgi:hypothetical protein
MKFRLILAIILLCGIFGSGLALAAKLVDYNITAHTAARSDVMAAANIWSGGGLTTSNITYGSGVQSPGTYPFFFSMLGGVTIVW